MDCVLSPDDIDNLPQSSSLVSCSGVSAINAHEITIITGTESARTALFAKMIAATVIGGTDYPFASGMTSQLKNGKVLWVDAVNSMQAMPEDVDKHRCCELLSDFVTLLLKYCEPLARKKL
jgi:hypothetical protein